MPPTPPSLDPIEHAKQMAAEAAVEYIQDGDIVGLGTGSTVKYLLLALGKKIETGFRIQGVPTSQATADLARTLEIPLLPDEGGWSLDIAIDGADQIDGNLNLIKGGGGALLREKIVAAAARRFIVIADVGKRVDVLGLPMPLPVEVEPFGWPSTARAIRKWGYQVELRERQGSAFRTDGGHFILDVHIDRIDDPERVEMMLNQIPGVVDNGLFVGRTSMVIVGGSQGVDIVQGNQGHG